MGRRVDGGFVINIYYVLSVTGSTQDLIKVTGSNKFHTLQYAIADTVMMRSSQDMEIKCNYSITASKTIHLP